MNILIIEDDRAIFNELAQIFESWQLPVVGVNDFKHVMEDFYTHEPKLVLIDIQLPAFDGFHWCREIRAQSNVPIIFLSSRDHPLDMVMAMQLGADDFVQKPFHKDVLVAKVKALLRRAYDYKETTNEQEIWLGAQIDYDRAIVTKGNEQIELTKNELFILKVLLQAKGQIVTREVLIRKLWDDERFVNDNTLTVNVNRLRQKLIDIGLTDAITTKKGLGYMAVTQ